MIELALGIATGAGATWLLTRKTREIAAKNGHLGTNNPTLARLEEASLVLKDLEVSEPSAGIREALAVVTTRRMRLLECGTPPVKREKPGPKAEWAHSWALVLLALLAAGAGTAWGGGLVGGISWALAMLAVGSMAATHWKVELPWVGWASVGLIGLQAGMTAYWVSGGTELDQIAVEAANRPAILAGLALSAFGWMARRAMAGSKMLPIQAWLVWGSVLLLGAGMAKAGSVWEGLPALMGVILAYGATVDLFSFWAAGKDWRARGLGPSLQALAGAFAILWVGAALKGIPWGPLGMLAGLAALSATVRGLAWRSIGWTVAGSVAGVCALMAGSRALDLAGGIALSLAGSWVGLHGLGVLGASRKWPVARRAWLDGLIGCGLASHLVPAMAALVCRILLVESDSWEEFGSISGSPMFLLAAAMLSLAGIAGPGRRQNLVREAIISAWWILAAGWASGMGALPGLACLALGGLLMSGHASMVWFPAALSLVSILATVGLETREPATWPAVLAGVAGVGVVTGLVLGIRFGVKWWHFSGLSAIFLALGISGGSGGSVMLVAASLAACWSCLGLILRAIQFGDGDDSEGSPRLAILLSAMACGAIGWAFALVEMPARLPLVLSLGASLAGCLALTRFKDLALRQGMAMGAALLASAQAGMALASWLGRPDLAGLLAVAAAGPGLSLFLGLLMFLCHDLSPVVLGAARAATVLIPLAAAGIGSESQLVRLALPWAIGNWAFLGWVVSMEMDRRRKVAAIGWRSISTQAAVATLACLGWALTDPSGDARWIARASMATCGMCLGLLAVASIEGGRLSVPWLTRRSCRVALGRLDWLSAGMLATTLFMEAARYAGPADSAWQGLPPAMALAGAFCLYVFARLAREVSSGPWLVILPCLGLFLHLAWTSSRGPEENLGLMFLASACLVALGGAWHAAGRVGAEAFRAAGIGMVALVLGCCLLEARGTSPEGMQRAFFQGGLSFAEQSARALNVGLVLAGTLVVAGLTGGARVACSAGACFALVIGVLRQALDGQPWVAVAPQGLGVLALAVSLLRRDREGERPALAEATARDSRAA